MVRIRGTLPGSAPFLAKPGAARYLVASGVAEYVTEETAVKGGATRKRRATGSASRRTSRKPE